MTTNFKFVQAQDFQLSGAGSVIGATSIVLKSFTGIDGITLLTMTDFGAIGFATIEPGNGTQEEQISFTGVTQNPNGTATLTGVNSVTFTNPYTGTSGTLKTHAGSTTLVITNTAGFYDQFPAKANDETITGQWTFSSFPITPATPDASATVKGMTKLSVAPTVAANPVAVGANDLATAANKGITRLSLAPDSATDPVALGANDGRIPIAYAVDSVGSDAYAIAPSPAITAYAAGQHFTFQAGTANTTGATLNVSALGAKTILKNVTEALNTGDILANQIVEVVYDGTNMQLISKTPVLTPVVKTYLTGGSPATWTKPAGLKYVIVEVQAGGGGGGDAAAGGSSEHSGSGGGAGGYSRKLIAAATLGATETVTTGAGGAKEAAGSASSFGAHATATGGGAGANGAAAGGLGGIGSSGDINLAGGDGESVLHSGEAGGSGGQAILGGGGGGGFGTNGEIGGVYGGGGGGGNTESGGSGTDGGAGGAGIVIVTEYF